MFDWECFSTRKRGTPIILGNPPPLGFDGDDGANDVSHQIERQAGPVVEPVPPDLCLHARSQERGPRPLEYGHLVPATKGLLWGSGSIFKARRERKKSIRLSPANRNCSPRMGKARSPQKPSNRTTGIHQTAQSKGRAKRNVCAHPTTQCLAAAMSFVVRFSRHSPKADRKTKQTSGRQDKSEGEEKTNQPNHPLSGYKQRRGRFRG